MQKSMQAEKKDQSDTPPVALVLAPVKKDEERKPLAKGIAEIKRLRSFRR